MATTTNFGWETPDDTDLVKDGAAAIRTLGGAIDTSLVDLKGGTTGQILSKASNTDMDFTWTSANPGDIEGVTAGTGLTGGGTSGTVTLSLDQANYGGGQWAAGKNKIINGNFAINQRAFTSNTTTGSYNFDRWRQGNGGTTGTLTVTPQTFTPGTAPVSNYEARNFVRCVTASGASTNTFAILVQPIEDVRTLAGQTATISFWAKAGSGTPKIAVELEQEFGTGGSPSSNVFTYAGQATLSTSWARYSLTVSVPSLSGKTIGTTANTSVVYLNLWLSAGSTLDSRSGTLGLQNATFDIWGVQVEAGSVSTPFQTATGTIQGELAACQRYFNSIDCSLNANAFLGVGVFTATTNLRASVALPVVMRVKPSVSFSAGNTFLAQDGGNYTGSAISADQLGVNNVGVNLTVSGATAYRAGILLGNSTSGAISVSAEL